MEKASGDLIIRLRHLQKRRRNEEWKKGTNERLERAKTTRRTAGKSRANVHQYEKGNGERSTGAAPKTVYGAQKRNVALTNKTLQAQGGRNVSTLIPSVPSMTENMMHRDVKCAIGLQKQGHYTCWPRQCFS